MSVLAGRRILVTGGLGFLGLNLVRPLLAEGACLRILNRSAHPMALRWLAELAQGQPVEFRQGDIADNRLSGWLADSDAVVNLAGESGAVKSLTDSRTDMQVNIAGHLNLLDSLRTASVPPPVVFISSRLVYGITGSAPVTEEQPPRPTSLYGLHKLTVEHYHRIYWEQYGIPYVVLRVTNPYGPFQLPQRTHYGVVNQFAMRALRNDPIRLFGGGGQLRDYVHAGDVAQAIVSACQADSVHGETFNIGSGQSISLHEVAERIVAAAGAGSLETVAWPDSDKKVETGDFLCDTSRVRAKLGWRAAIDLEGGLRETVNFYRAALA